MTECNLHTRKRGKNKDFFFFKQKPKMFSKEEEEMKKKSKKKALSFYSLCGFYQFYTCVKYNFCQILLHIVS